MPYGNPRIRIDRQTYEAINELARRWNVSAQKVIAIAVNHALSCNRVGTQVNYPPAQQANTSDPTEPPPWWRMCADTLWVCAAIIDALHRLADIYPDLKADWTHAPYEAARRLEVVAKDWGLWREGEGTGEATEEEAEERGEGVRESTS